MQIHPLLCIYDMIFNSAICCPGPTDRWRRSAGDQPQSHQEGVGSWRMQCLAVEGEPAAWMKQQTRHKCRGWTHRNLDILKYLLYLYRFKEQKRDQKKADIRSI